MYRSSSIAKGMPIGLSLVGRTSCSHRNGIIPSGMLRFPPRDSGRKEPSRIRLVVIDRPSRRGWHRFIQLRKLSVGLQPKPQVLRVDRTRSRRGSFAVITPRPGCNASRRACSGQAQDLACSLILFQAGDISPACSRIGGRACPIGRVMSTELAIWIFVRRISWSRTVWIQEPQSLMSQRGLNSSIRTKRMLDQRQ